MPNSPAKRHFRAGNWSRFCQLFSEMAPSPEVDLHGTQLQGGENGGSRMAEDRGGSLRIRQRPLTAGSAFAPASTAIVGAGQSSRSGTAGSHPEVGRAESRPLRQRSRALGKAAAAAVRGRIRKLDGPNRARCNSDRGAGQSSRRGTAGSHTEVGRAESRPLRQRSRRWAKQPQRQ